MKTIPVINTSHFRFHAGEDIRRLWGDHRNRVSDHIRRRETIFLCSGPSCPSTACNRCERMNCFFGEFIRNYLDGPISD